MTNKSKEDKIAEYIARAELYAGSVDMLGVNYNKVRDTKFYELIVGECLDIIVGDIVLNGDTPENKRTWLHITKIKEYFEIEKE